MPLDCPKVGAKWRTHCRPSNLQLFRFFQWRNVKNLFQVLLRNENNWRIETIGGVSVLWMFIELQPSQLGNWLQADPWKKHEFHAISTSQDACILWHWRQPTWPDAGSSRIAIVGELDLNASVLSRTGVTRSRWSSWGNDAHFSEWTNSTPGFNTWQHTDERHTFKNWGIWIKDN